MIPEVPPLLHERLEAQYGAELAREIEAGYVRKRTTFRVNPLKGDREAVLREIADTGIATEPIAWYDDAFLLPDGNEEQLRSAISNLVYNAVNHTPPGTEIRVSWQRTPQGALFSVEDNGPGIAPEHIPRLTERFYRVDKARSRQTGGSGLGLAIVKHAVNHHDSRLEIESTVGKGTRFSFLLPERLIARNDT